jgi:hypothetical protein
MTEIPIRKDDSMEHAIPSQWRPVIKGIVDALRHNTSFRGEVGILIKELPSSEYERIFRNIQSYGGSLAELPEETWSTSICQWQDGYWELLVDLFTNEDDLSDLALFLKVEEGRDRYIFTIQSVHVP